MTDLASIIDPDAMVDDEILGCLDIESPKSFFLFAGAGSGKTRSLVNVLRRLRTDNGERLRLHRQKVAVITYTNAACNEIIHRLGYDELFSVSTIHSFIWELIKPFQQDIREWLRSNLKAELDELASQQAKSKSQANKTYIERAGKIKSKERRLEALDFISYFTYNPNGDNRGRDSLNHSEVIALGAFFITDTLLGKKILAQKFPILLIDESQDTNKDLLEAFFSVQKELPASFSLGLMGDTMQRIYSDGKIDLGQNLPVDWIKPRKVMNHRSPKKVISLINRIRHDVDGIVQVARSDKEDGFVRIFLVPQNSENKIEIETKIADRMAEISSDELWKGPDANIKILTLEHHMAASRMGFLPFYAPLSTIDKFKTGLLDGTLPGLRVFTQCVLPLVKAHRAGDSFGVAQVVRKNAPLLSKKSLINCEDQMRQLDLVKDHVNQLTELWIDSQDPTIVSVLRILHQTGLFEIHDSILPILMTSQKALPDEEGVPDEDLIAWEAALACPFSMVEQYDDYVSDSARFGTHQGVKGLEFERVMVILDDGEAKGFMFSFEKLFGVKEKSKTDLSNESEGKETGIDRSKRLFYVTCSRAKKSLAIVAYTENPTTVKQFVIDNGWFDENEVVDYACIAMVQ